MVPISSVPSGTISQMSQLTGRLITSVYPGPDHKWGHIMLVEPNGDEHLVHVLVRDTGEVELSGDGEMLEYLNTRYEPQTVCLTARKTLLPADF